MVCVSRVLIAAAVLSLPAGLTAQTPAHTRAGLKSTYDIGKGNIIKAVAQIGEDLYAFKPVPEVRSMGQLFGHIANANFMICATAAGEKSPATTNFETVTKKADMEKAIADSFAYCDTVWAKIEGDKGSEAVDVFGMKHTRASAMAFNGAHDWEHYGNVVTYMRLKGMTPPSSQGGGGN
ncbi:MAG: DinB family protein [Acidobacteriota bacterium]|nr:DinB family protein [Acidobacteriota bacterium]